VQSNVGLSAARVRHAVSAGVGVGLLSLAACEIPEAPNWDVGVVLPFTSDTITIIDFLPRDSAQVLIVDTATIGGQRVFTVQVQQDAVDYRLGQMCSLCQSSAGLTIAVPGFEYTDSLDVLFPDDLITLELITARLSIGVQNGLNFDPLRPHPDPDSAGFIALVARDVATGATIDSVFISGASRTMRAGSTTEFEFGVANSILSEGLRIVFHIRSPQDGQTVTIDPDLNARISGLLDQITVSGVTVVVDNRTLDEDERIEVDQGVRDELANRVQSGEFELELLHNLQLSGDFTSSIAGSRADLFSGDPSREVRLNQLVFTPGPVQTGQLTREEIELIASFPTVFLGYRANASGTETGPKGQLNVGRFTPDQFLQVKLKLTSIVRVAL
jgi:hypothetical protein